MLRGNLVIAQSGGPTAVINNSIAGIVQEAFRYSAIEGIYGALNGVLGLLYEDLVDLRHEEPETIQGLRATPSAVLGSCRRRLTEEDLARILDVLRAHNIRYVLLIGGNDTMDSAHKVSDLGERSGYELRVMGVPKTVDNDLVCTDHCPGYPSVARWWSIGARDAGLDTDAIYHPDTVKVLETMGRDAGWITASTALAKQEDDDAPHLIYLPESTFYEDKFLADVDQVYDRLGRAVIAVCEGLKDESGDYLVATKGALYTDTFGHAQPGGVADYLCRLIAAKLKLKARYDKPGTIQRVSMVCVSDVDVREAYLVGKAAVREAVQGKTSYMVALKREPGPVYRSTTGLVRLEDVAGKTKKVPEEFINKEDNFVTDKFIEYARPLIGRSALEYARLRKFQVEKVMKPYTK